MSQHATRNNDRNLNHRRAERPNVEPIATEKVYCDAERKKFFLDLRENERGVVLRIKEDSGNGRTNFIMIPGASIAEFSGALDAILEVYNQR